MKCIHNAITLSIIMLSISCMLTAMDKNDTVPYPKTQAELNVLLKNGYEICAYRGQAPYMLKTKSAVTSAHPQTTNTTPEELPEKQENKSEKTDDAPTSSYLASTVSYMASFFVTTPSQDQNTKQ